MLTMRDKILQEMLSFLDLRGVHRRVSAEFLQKLLCINL